MNIFSSLLNQFNIANIKISNFLWFLIIYIKENLIILKYYLRSFTESATILEVTEAEVSIADCNKFEIV